MKIKKNIGTALATILTVVLLAGLLPGRTAYASLSTVNTPRQVSAFESTDSFEGEYLKAYVPAADGDHVLRVVCRTQQPTTLFELSLYRVGAGGGRTEAGIRIEPGISYGADGLPTYGFTYRMNMEDLEVPNGRYNLYIRRCETPEQAAAYDFGANGPLYKNLEIQVRGGKVKILRYDDVLAYNGARREIGDRYPVSDGRYTDMSLTDIRFCLRNPDTNVYATMTPDKISYFRTISNRLTTGVYSDYEKLRRFYEYAAENFYYDTIAFQTHSRQFADPYENIYSFETGRTTANSQQGRVYTTCQGFSAIVIALARAQNIPCRLAYGHRLSVPDSDWESEPDIDVRDHWWLEAYVNGHWIFIDPTVGTDNKYNSRTGVWTYTGLTNYTYFDPSEEQIATSHVYMNIFPNYQQGKYLTNAYETQTLRAFLDARSAGDDPWLTRTNGDLLSDAYDPLDVSTWGDGITSHFMSDGRGQAYKIQWSNYGFSTGMHLPHFTQLVLLSSHGNHLTDVDLAGDTALEKVYLYDNDIRTLDMTDCRKAWYVRAQNNPMEKAVLYVNGSNRTFTAEAHGTFYLTLDTRYKATPLSLYAEPDLGYKLGGVYSAASGSRLATESPWHFKPQATSYLVRFAPDPDSFRYTLTVGDSQQAHLPYIQAAAARLGELGYVATVQGETVRVFDAALGEAVQHFQVVNDLTDSGILDEETWRCLFSEEAARMVPVTQYPQVQAAYEARREAREDALLVLSAISLHASSEAEDGGIRLRWSLSVDRTGDVAVDARIASLLPQDAGVDAYPDGFEVWRAEGDDGEYMLWEDVEPGRSTFKNTAVEKGTRYYYLVRAYKEIGSRRLYTDWSNPAYRKAR